MRRLYREQINRAGGYMDVSVYPVFATPGKRKSRFKPTSEVQAKLNERNSKKALIRLIHRNFTQNDIALHLTYNDSSLPGTVEEALRDVQNFLRRVKRIYQGSGMELKYIWVCEKGEKSNRVHHHLILNTITVDEEILTRFARRNKINEKECSLRTIIEMLWNKGYANTKRLQFGENGVEGLAHYITKQKLFFKRFNTSKNLKKPEVLEKQGRIWHRDLGYIEATEDLYIIERLYPGYEITGKPYIIENEVNGGFYMTMTFKKV